MTLALDTAILNRRLNRATDELAVYDEREQREPSVEERLVAEIEWCEMLLASD